MTDTTKVELLKRILKDQIDWYLENKELEDRGEVDSSYIYDQLYEVFNNLRRTDYLSIIETLLEE